MQSAETIAKSIKSKSRNTKRKKNFNLNSKIKIYQHKINESSLTTSQTRQNNTQTHGNDFVSGGQIDLEGEISSLDSPQAFRGRVVRKFLAPLVQCDFTLEKQYCVLVCRGLQLNKIRHELPRVKKFFRMKIGFIICR